LLDCHRRPVFTNRAALQLAALNDGLRIDDDSPRLWDSQENTLLRKLIDCAIESCLKDGKPSAQVISISRPSGKRPFVALISSLLRPIEALAHDAVAAVFVGDATDVKLSGRETLEGLYSLTKAEAELVGLLAAGNSLDEVATVRGITMNTARSQLKQVFVKTDTRRQGELVQLVLSGVATIQPQ
jgi:DNA-binding CsgD family transcriptional regulator